MFWELSTGLDALTKLCWKLITISFLTINIKYHLNIYIMKIKMEKADLTIFKYEGPEWGFEGRWCVE